MIDPQPGPFTPDERLRAELSDLLIGGATAVTADVVFSDIPEALQHVRPPSAVRTLFELLTHIGYAQMEVLRFFVEAGSAAPVYPVPFWTPRGPRDDEWERALGLFVAIQQRLAEIVLEPERDLMAEVPHAPGHTLLREALLLAEHTAYHVGQAVSVRQALGIWPPTGSTSDGAPAGAAG